MASTIDFEERLTIPPIESLAEFRRWALSDAFPESGRIDYIAGLIEVDMSLEDYYLHGKLKSEIVRVLANRLLEDEEFGDILTDSTRVSSVEGDLSVEPDVVVISHEALNAGRIRLVPKATQEADRFVEVEGAPDLVVEIISDSSVTKDKKRLPKAYFAAGVLEFWLIDARQEPLLFQIFRRGSKHFEPVATDAEGFRRCEILNRHYMLERSRNSFGRLRFELIEKS
jgi:Uma2 family endonuclease